MEEILCQKIEPKFRRNPSVINIKNPIINFNGDQNPTKTKIINMLNRENISDKLSSKSSKSDNKQKSQKEQQFIFKIKELSQEVLHQVSKIQKTKNQLSKFFSEQIDYTEKQFDQMINQLSTLKEQTLQAIQKQDIEHKQKLQNLELQMNHNISELDRLQKFEKYENNSFILDQKLSFLQNLQNKCIKKKIRLKKVYIECLPEEIVALHDIILDEPMEQDKSQSDIKDNHYQIERKQSPKNCQEDQKIMEKNFFDFVNQKIKQDQQNTSLQSFKRTLFN